MVLNNKNNKIISGGKYVKSSKNDIDPDEIFLDSSNLPNFDTHQFEGRIVSSISRRSIAVLSIFILLIFFIFFYKIVVRVVDIPGNDTIKVIEVKI